MAVAAAQAGVGAIQCKARVARMIETRVVPAIRAVTVLALLPTAAFVDVVGGMAAVTGRRRVGERVVLVAVEAGSVVMQSDQRPPGRVVIESDIEPTIGSVAVATLGAHGIAMHIVGLVAAVAVLRCVAELDVGFMAVVTLRLGMVADEREIGPVMIEALPVESHDIGIAAFVVGMASEAGTTAGLPVAAMKAQLHFDVGRDVLVAIEAQGALFVAIEGLVTSLAIGLELRVTLDDFTGHDQGLDLGIGNGRYERRCNHHDNR